MGLWYHREGATSPKWRGRRPAPGALLSFGIATIRQYSSGVERLEMSRFRFTIERHTVDLTRLFLHSNHTSDMDCYIFLILLTGPRPLSEPLLLKVESAPLADVGRLVVEDLLNLLHDLRGELLNDVQSLQVVDNLFRLGGSELLSAPLQISRQQRPPSTRT